MSQIELDLFNEPSKRPNFDRLKSSFKFVGKTDFYKIWEFGVIQIHYGYVGKYQLISPFWAEIWKNNECVCRIDNTNEIGTEELYTIYARYVDGIEEYGYYRGGNHDQIITSETRRILKQLDYEP